jgi:hypothetical protein
LFFGLELQLLDVSGAAAAFDEAGAKLDNSGDYLELDDPRTADAFDEAGAELEVVMGLSTTSVISLM